MTRLPFCCVPQFKKKKVKVINRFYHKYYFTINSNGEYAREYALESPDPSLFTGRGKVKEYHKHYGGMLRSLAVGVESPSKNLVTYDLRASELPSRKNMDAHA